MAYLTYTVAVQKKAGVRVMPVRLVTRRRQRQRKYIAQILIATQPIITIAAPKTASAAHMLAQSGICWFLMRLRFGARIGNVRRVSMTTLVANGKRLAMELYVQKVICLRAPRRTSIALDALVQREWMMSRVVLKKGIV